MTRVQSIGVILDWAVSLFLSNFLLLGRHL